MCPQASGLKRELESKLEGKKKNGKRSVTVGARNKVLPACGSDRDLPPADAAASLGLAGLELRYLLIRRRVIRFENTQAEPTVQPVATRLTEVYNRQLEDKDSNRNGIRVK